MKNTLTLILLLYVAIAHAQINEVSKDQMYEDYDYLVSKIEQFNPSISIKEELFLYPLMDSIKAFRQKIEECNNSNDFHRLTTHVMNLCVDGHSVVKTPVLQEGINLWIPLAYIDGEYHIKQTFTYQSKRFEVGAKLIAINGQEVHNEVRLNVPYRYMMRWDHERSRFYSEIFYWSYRYFQKGGVELTFEHKGETTVQQFEFKDVVEFDSELSWLGDTKRVEYWEKEKILYLRVPNMNWDTRRFYKKQIIQQAKNKEVEKVIVDLRWNLGGSSVVGRNIIRSLIAEPIHLEYKNYGVSPENLSGKYKKQHGIQNEVQQVSIPFMEDQKMYQLVNKEEKIKPFSRSIKHTGKIYLVGDNQLYSAGGAIFKFARASASDNIVSVGTKTGYFLGEFSDPVYFELPNSGIRCGISPAMDFGGVNTIEDMFHDSYDIEVNPTPKDYQEKYLLSGDIYGMDYLLNYDPYFKTILAQ